MREVHYLAPISKPNVVVRLWPLCELVQEHILAWQTSLKMGNNIPYDIDNKVALN